MKMNEQTFIKLANKLETGKLACRILVILLAISLGFNIVLGLDILKLRSELDFKQKVIPVIETAEPNETISLIDVTDQLPTLPAIPNNLK